jgi:hypothetical protein
MRSPRRTPFYLISVLDTSAVTSSPSLADIFIGLVVFETTACRRGDRSTF